MMNCFENFFHSLLQTDNLIMRISFSCIALFVLSAAGASAFSSSSSSPTPTKFDRKCPFHTLKDNVTFTNKVSLPKETYYRIMQVIQRKFAENGGPNSSNPLVRMVGAPFTGSMQCMVLPSTLM